MSGSNDGAASSAEELFAQYLALAGSGDPVDFDALCRDYLDQAADLRRLKSARDALHQQLLEARPQVEDVPHVSVIERLRQEFGDDVDPGRSIQDADSSGSFAKELVSHLGQRSGSFGRYTVDEEIGRGGMGTVLRVWDQDLRRWLAMKLVRARRNGGPPQAEAVGTRTLGRFLEEAQVTGQLDHPGIVPVHELGLDSEGRVYFTMKLVEGRTLQTVFDELAQRKGGWTQTGVLGLLLKVCEAMSYAHDKGVIHRDLKPSNVMVGRFGEVYVMDWGLARVLSREDHKDLQPRPPESDGAGVFSRSIDTPLTIDGEILGTPAYMPPEQARGQIDRLDKRADVYALGAMLYQLLTGQIPYLGAGERPPWHALVARVLAGPPQPITSLRRDQPAELAAICDMAMAREPADRYSDMAAMAADLRAYLEGRVVRAHRTGALAEFGKWVARNRGMAASLGAAVLLALGGLGAVALERTRAAKSRLAQAYFANLRAAEAALRAGACADSQHMLSECEEQLRGWEWFHLEAQRDSSLRQITKHGNEVRAVAISSDRRKVVSVGADACVRLTDLESKETLDLVGHKSTVYAVAFAPDSKTFATGADDTSIRIWNADTGNLVRTLRHHTKGLLALVYSHDGKRLFSGADDNTLCVFDLASEGAPLVQRVHDGFVDSIAISPDDQLVASASADGSILLWSGDGSRCLGQLASGLGGMRSVSFDQDGARLVAGGDDGCLRLFDIASRRLIRTIRADAGAVRSVAFVSGERLVTAGRDGTLRIFDMLGNLLSVHRGHDGSVNCAAVGLGGTRVVSGGADGRVLLWEPAATATTRLQGHTRKTCTVEYCAGTGELASASEDNTIRIWDEATLLPLAVLRSPLRGEQATGWTKIAWSRDSRWLAAGLPDGRVALYAPPEPMPVRYLDTGASKINCLAFEVSGERVAAGGRDGEIRILEVTGGASLILRGHAGVVRNLAWYPDGSKLVSAGVDGTVRIWDARLGACLHVLRGPQGEAESVAVAPDGKRIASGHASGDVCVWDASDGRLLQICPGHLKRVCALDFQPKDGARLVSGDGEESVRVWDPKDGTCLAMIQVDGAKVDSLCFSPDGQRLAVTTRNDEGDFDILESTPSAERERHAAPKAHEDETEQLVLDLQESGVDRTTILEGLRADPSLAPERLEQALRIARTTPGDVDELQIASWRIACAPGHATKSYARALQLARIAHKLRPDDRLVRRALVAARYRTGDDEGVLELADSAETATPDLAILAFRALALARKGQCADAEKVLSELKARREVVTAAGDDPHDASRDLMIEAADAVAACLQLDARPR